MGPWAFGSMAPQRILAVVGFRKPAWDTLFAPDLSSGPLWMLCEVIIPLAIIPIDSGFRFLDRLVVAVVDDGPSHPAKD